MTTGQNFAALYDASRVLLAITADQSTAWGTSGVKSMALAGGPLAIAAGYYYVGFWMRVSGGSPTINRAISNTLANPNPLNLRYGSSTGSLTTTAPDPAAALSASTIAWWVAMS